MEQVGIRSRGDGSRNEEKPGLKIDFNKYVKTQEFHGYKTMVLDNLWQDPSLMRERLAFLVFEAMGIPAPQIAHARAHRQRRVLGRLHARRVGQQAVPEGAHRRGERQPLRLRVRGALGLLVSGAARRARTCPSPFEPQTNEDHLDATGLIDFVRAINETPDATFARDIARLDRRAARS